MIEIQMMPMIQDATGSRIAGSELDDPPNHADWFDVIVTRLHDDNSGMIDVIEEHEELTEEEAYRAVETLERKYPDASVEILW